MAKEALKVASSDPVSIEAEKKTELEPAASQSSSTDNAAKGSSDQKPASTKINGKDDELEEVAVDDEVEKKVSKPKDSSAGKSQTGTSVSERVNVSSAEKPASSEDTRVKDAKEKQPSPKNDDPEGPPRPNRPVSPIEQMKIDLKEAFPSIEEKYINAFLIASEGRMDPAFNALLSLSDPSFKPEPTAAPRKPSRREENPQFTDDELLARQLQKEFDKEERRRRAAAKSHQRSSQPSREEEDDSPDEIDQLKEQFSQGFEEAKTTINSWVSGITKKFSQDGESGPSAGSNSNTKLFGALGGSSFNSTSKPRPNKFDEDPEILSSDFSRRVDLRENNAPSLPRRTESSKQDNKWQPLNSDVPVSSDAFLVTDSEEEDKK